MSAPARKLADLGKPWLRAPDWPKEQYVERRTEPDGPAVPSAPPLSALPFSKPADPAVEFRRQYEIWRNDHPTPSRYRQWLACRPWKRAAALARKPQVAFAMGGVSLAAFYFIAVMPNLNGQGFQPASAPVPVPREGQSVVPMTTKTARLDVPPMPLQQGPVAAPPWPQDVPVETIKPSGPAAAPQAVADQETAQPQAAPAPAAEPDVKPQLSAEEIDLLIRRGEEFIGTGDLAAARLLLERAARSRSARAAFALASTYDPSVLDKMQVYGATGDIELAIMWYERAKQYGSRDAGQRLTALAGRM